jgi:hypothetical protein
MKAQGLNLIYTSETFQLKFAKIFSLSRVLLWLHMTSLTLNLKHKKLIWISPNLNLSKLTNQWSVPNINQPKVFLVLKVEQVQQVEQVEQFNRIDYFQVRSASLGWLAFIIEMLEAASSCSIWPIGNRFSTLQGQYLNSV